MVKKFLKCLVVCSVVGVASATPPFDIDQIKEQLTTLSSDEFEGRFPATKGDTLSHNFILDELSKIDGVELYGNDGMQRFDFALKESHSTKDNATLILGGEELVWNVDYFPTAYSASGFTSAPVIFAGYGINAFGDKSRNDYDGIDINGKWALILRETPEDRLAYTDLCTDYAKVQEAERRGAAGVILVHGTKDRWQLLESTDLWQPQCDIPVVCITREAANKILSGTNTTIEALESQWSAAPQGNVIESNESLTSHLKINRVMTPTCNIIAMIEGNDPKLKHELIVIGAHYDHYGTIVYRGKLGEPTHTKQVYNGANDNGTGTVALLALARRYSEMRGKLKRTVVFAFIGAEERGLVGAKYMSQNHSMLSPYGEMKLMVNYDMIGSLPRANNQLHVYGIGTLDTKRDIVGQNMGKTDLDVRVSQGVGITSDHIPFLIHAAVPVMGFATSDPEFIHTPFDDIDKIDFDGMLRILEFSAHILDDIIIDGVDFKLEEEVF